MRTFYDNSTWGGKINFIDKNNVLVGFDMRQSCCEYFGWFIHDEVTANTELGSSNIEELNKSMENYNFDKEFFVSCNGENGSESEEGTIAFKLVDDSGNVKYLHLFNHHNGYYSHGFVFKDGDVFIKNDSI